MSDYEIHKLFYEQFNTVIHNHSEWLQSPQGCVEVLKDPWKAQPPVVRIDSPFEENKARDILAMIRERQAARDAVNPPTPRDPAPLKKIRKQIAAAAAAAVYKEQE